MWQNQMFAVEYLNTDNSRWKACCACASNYHRLVCRGLEQQVALPRDSYLQHYFADVTSVMRVGPPLFFVVSACSNRLQPTCPTSTRHAHGVWCQGLLANCG